MLESLVNVVREKTVVGKTLTSSNVILTSQIGNRQPGPVGVANGPIRSGLWQGGVRNKFHYATESMRDTLRLRYGLASTQPVVIAAEYMPFDIFATAGRFFMIISVKSRQMKLITTYKRQNIRELLAKRCCNVVENSRKDSIPCSVHACP
jgi:hypothetical protein